MAVRVCLWTLFFALLRGCLWELTSLPSRGLPIMILYGKVPEFSHFETPFRVFQDPSLLDLILLEYIDTDKLNYRRYDPA